MEERYCLAIVSILHKICLNNVVYGCANFSQEILIELITGNKNYVKYHLKTTQECIEV